MAFLNFVNAYTVYTAGSNPASKEQNSIDFVYTALNVARISDGSAGQSFSGNDVPVKLTIGGQDYYGWISRPIKSGGIVRGFYFWSDPTFVDLAAATRDGNMDGDANAANNMGFILVVDQAYFTQLANNAAPGAILNVGSSSDRVDTSLNSVIPVNSAPVGVNDAVTVSEGATATGNVLTNDTDANNDALSVTGFTIDGVAGTLGTAFSINNVGTFTLNANGSFTFVPAAEYNGTAPVVTYTVTDGKASTTAKLTITVTAANDAPTSSNDSLTILEDTATLLTLADFGSYSDIEGTPIAAVVISGLPAAGTGTLSYFNGTNWASVTANQSISAADINAGKLRFTPALNSTTATSLTFKVSDGGATSADYSLTITITGVNDAPAGADKTLSLSEDTPKTITALDFGFSDGSDSPSNALSSVIITALPRAGTLKLNNVAVNLGQSISLDDLDAGKLVFEPVANANGTGYASFSFKVQDNGGTLNGGIDTDPSANILTFDVTAVNDGPAARNDAATAAYSTTSAYRVSPSGNVITNDSDPEGDTLTATRLSAGASLGGSPTVIGATQTVVTNYNITGTESAAYSSVILKGSNLNNIPASGTVTGDGTTAIPLNTTYTKTPGTGSTEVITFSNPVLITGTSVLTFVSGATSISYTLSTASGNADTLTIDTSAVAISGASPSLANASTTIAQNMAVTGTNLTSGAKVQTVYTASSSTTSYQIVKLDKTFSSATPATDYSFATSQSSQVSGGPGVVNGTYGQLSLNADGSYTYSPTSGAGTDTFTYEIKDTSGELATAQLVVSVSTVSAGPPTVNADTNAVTEKYGTANATGLSSVAGNVLTDGTDDVASSGATSLRVDRISSQVSTTAESVNSDGTTSASVAGRYGTITILSTGAYTYQVDDANSTVQALNSGGSLTDVFTYRATDSGGNFASTTLTVTVNGANDGPVATDDTGAATEAGGTDNGIAGASGSGNVLTNDSDVDSARAGWTVSAVRTGSSEGNGTSGTVGSALSGTYGSLTLNSDGTYSYVVNEAAANGIAAGATATDSFNYTILDQSGGYSDIGVLSVTITGANDAPVNTLPATQTVNSYTSLAFAAAAFSVTDPDGNLASSSSVTLVAGKGSLAVSGTGGTISGAGTLASPLVISGTQDEVNARLSTLVYTPNGSYTGADSILMTSRDALGLTDSDSVTITVTPDNRSLTVTGTTVNEASPYVLFSVGGASGQYVSLSLSSGSAIIGEDATAGLEYYTANGWTAYTAASQIQLVGTSLIVRAPVLQDTSAEGAETLILVAKNQNAIGFSNSSTIKDDGTGDIFLADATSLTPSPSSSNGYPAALDDDRALTVENIRVNEASSHAVFTVTGAVNQVVTLSLVGGSATAGAGGDYTASLDYYNGSAWVPYSSSATIPSGGALLVRVPILPDTRYEGPENFGLKATNGSGVDYVGTATIYDDGTGTKFTGEAITTNGVPSPVTDASTLDNDLSVTVAAHGPVNEASLYAPFTIEATKGAALQLSVADGTSPTATISSFTIQFSYNGTTWFDYSASNTPLVPGDLGTGVDKVFVRVGIASEQETASDGPETFKLNVTMAAGGLTPLTASATATIVDAADGTIYSGDFTSGNPATSNTTLDDDRLLTVTGATVSENSGYAVFKISGAASQLVSLSLGNTTSSADRDATLGTDTADAGSSNIPLQIFDGSAWVDYTPASFVSLNGSGDLLARTKITNDNVYEGPETFTLIAQNRGGASFAGNATIVDNGSSTQVFEASNTSDTPSTGTADNDTPTLSIADVAAVEGGSATFTVQIDKQSAYDVRFTPTLSSGSATLGTDTAAASTLEISTDGGSNWNAATSPVTIAAGQTSLKLKLAITDDNLAELAETVTLSTGAITGGVTNAAGVTATATIAANDAPTLSITNVSVNEASPFAIVEAKLSAAAADTVSFTPSLVSGTATVGTDTESTIEYWNGTGWTTTGSFSLAAGATSLLLRVGIKQDTSFEGAESLTISSGTITGSVGSSQATSGTVTIKDDGTGAVFLASNNTATANLNTDQNYPALDNDMAIQVSSHGPVNEASSYVMFSIVADAGQRLSLTVANTTAALDLTDDQGGQDDNSWAAVEYSTDGSNWTSYSWNGTSGNRPTVPGTSGPGTVYARVRIASEGDTVFEGSETFTLTAETSTGAGKSGFATATIVDAGDGSLYSGALSGGTPSTTTSALDDDRPSFSVADISAAENAGTATVTVTRTGTTLLSSTISYATSDGTAAAASDYSATNGSLTFAANETTKTFTISLTNDTLDEDDETVAVTLSSATNAVIGDSSGVVTVTDNDTQSVSAIVARDAAVADNIVDTSVVEGNALVYTVTLSSAASTSKTHSLAWSGTTSGADYGTPQFSDNVTLTGANLTVPAGVSSFTVTVSTTDDSSVESDESLILTIGGASATGTVVDNDSNAVLSVTDLSVNEGSSFAVFTITGTSNNLALTLALASGTASGSGVDYGAASGTSLSYSTNGGALWQAYSGSFTATGASVLVRTPIVNDTGVDGGETFTLTATPATGTAGSGTATIVDDGSGSIFDSAGAVDNAATRDDDRPLTVNSFALNEASSYSVWTVAGAAGQKVALSLSGTASGGGTDYGATLEVKTTGGWASYDPNNKPVLPNNGSMSVRVSIVDDAISDDGETIILSATPVGGQAASGTATIRDQGTGAVYNAEGSATGLTATDDRPSISVASLTVQERDPYAITSISLSQPSSSAISFTPSLASGTATLTTDFGASLEYYDGANWVSAANGITIAPGTTSVQVRTLLVQDSLTNEGTERFTISTGAVTGPLRNAAGANGAISIVDAMIVGDPVITDVTEGLNDPTPTDLLTSDTTQVVTLTGETGATVSLFLLGNGQSRTQIAASQFQAAETALGSGVYRLDFGTNALQAGDYVARLTKNGTNSGYSNSFTIDSTPGLYDILARRETVQISQNSVVTNGAVGGLDQSRLPTFWTGTEWRDSDGEIIRFSFDAPAQFNKASPPSATTITSTAPSGSTLVLNTQTGSYTYTPAANAKIDSFTVYASDGAKGNKLKLTFDASDTLDRDGIPAAVESRLAQLVAGNGNGGDLNNDGVADASQNALATLAWTTVDKFTAALDGSLNDTRPIISLQVLQSTSGATVDESTQLFDVQVLAPNSSVVGGSKPANASWDPIQFSLEPMQSVGLVDIDPTRAGTQVRVLIDIGNTQVAAGTFTRYMKYVDATAVAAGVVDLDGRAITTPGWYDFTQRVAGGDGARFITSGGIITGIELILTDNAFGDNDPTVGRIFDPGVPTGDANSGGGGGGGGGGDGTPPLITGPSNGAGAPDSAKAIPENTRPVAQFTANESVTWSISGGADAGLFTLDAATGALIFTTAPDYEDAKDQGRNNVYDLVITATDLAGNVSSQTVAVTVTDVDDIRPIITGPSNGAGAQESAARIPENTLPVWTFSANEAATWAIVGGVDAGYFKIDPQTGALTFDAAPDFEQPRDAGTDNIYNLIVAATDRAGNASTQMVAVTVTNVIEGVPVYAAPLSAGDRFLSGLQSEAAQKAAANGSVARLEFYGTADTGVNTLVLKAYVNLITGDYFYAPEGTPLPYDCYVPVNDAHLPRVLAPGAGAFDVHLFINNAGITQIMGMQSAASLNLASQGYQDMGVLFASAAPLTTATNTSSFG